jgi:O-antigen/teichoic acid export membrane protein
VAEETKDERVNRELIELLNELRVALPGVQVLFAFLLTVPFSNGWKRITEFQKDVFVAAILCTTVSTAFLIAPSAHHRILFRGHDKERLLFTANRLAIIGIAFLALAMSATLLLVIDVVYDRTWAAVIAAAAAGMFAVLWYGLPLWRRRSAAEDL